MGASRHIYIFIYIYIFIHIYIYNIIFARTLTASFFFFKVARKRENCFFVRSNPGVRNWKNAGNEKCVPQDYPDE